MQTLVSFSGRNAIDNESVRHLLARIPEVSKVLRSAQSVLDKNFDLSVDLMGYVTSLNEDYFKRPRLQGLCACLVQVGLFQRLQKNNTKIDFVMGNASVEDAMSFILGNITLEQLILSSEYAEHIRDTKVTSEPRLMGLSLEHFKAYSIDFNEKKIMELKSQNMNSHLQLNEMLLQYPITHVIRLTSVQQVGAVPLSTVQSVSYTSSLEIDPILSFMFAQAAG